MRISDWSSDVCSSDLEELAVAGGLALEAGVVLAVLAHRFDAVGARAFGRIPLAAQDHLAVAGLEVELVLAVGALDDLELDCHACSPDSVDERRILQVRE